MTNEQSLQSKKIHLQVASGSKVRALLYNNIIYCATVTRPLISIGQMKSMLDLRFVWSDSSPLLLACSGGLKHVLLEATIFHHLPVITSQEMMALLEAVHTCTATGALWNAATWSEKLGHKLPLFHCSTSSHPVYLPHDDAAFIDDPQVMFSSMGHSRVAGGCHWRYYLHCILALCLSSYSSSQALPPSSSDALPSSSVLTYDLRNQDPPTEDEEGGVTHEPEKKVKESQSHDSPRNDARLEEE